MAASNKHLWYPDNLQDTTAHPAWLQFQFRERRSPAGDDSQRISDTIDLYMPEQTANPSTVHWGTESFGFLGNALAAGARRTVDGSFDEGLITAAMSGAKETLHSMRGIGGLAATRFLANAGSAAVSLFGGNVTAEGLIGEVTGKTPNPYLTAVFKGVDFRNFSFVFKFYPFREKDCEIIDDIIKTFRAHALPSFNKSDEAFLGYPSECQISYKWRGADNKFLPKFKPAVCTAIDVDYTSQGMFSVMRNGFPSEITLATKWSEIEIVTREDIDKGH